MLKISPSDSSACAERAAVAMLPTGERNFVALADRDHYEEPASVRRMPPMRGTFLVRQ